MLKSPLTSVLKKTVNSYNLNALFQTLTNIFQFQLVLYHLFCTTIDTLRSVVGPLPYAVCTVNVYVKNLAHINISLFSLAMTATKFAYVCIYKSIPIMEDNFLSTVIFTTSNTISILAAAAKLYLPGRPILNVVNIIQFKFQIADIKF